MGIVRTAVVAALLALLAAPASAQVRPGARRTVSREAARLPAVQQLSQAELRSALSETQRARLERRGNALVARLVAARAFERELTARERQQVERYVSDVARAAGRDTAEVREAAWELAATQLERRRALLAANEHVLRRARHLVRVAMAELRRAQRAGTEATYVRPSLGRDGERLVLDEARVTTSEDDAMEAIGELASMNQSFNMQYLELQRVMQTESREFNLLSTVMKAKHDAARSAVQNIR